MSVINPPTTPPFPPPSPPENDPFRYGWRFVRKIGPDGREDLEQVPLTLEDVLHPQEDDQIPENDVQDEERGDFARILRLRWPREQGNRVFSGCIVNWGVPGIRNHSPDVSMFTGIVWWQPEPIGIFDLAASGGRCRMALEIVSPDTRVNDVERKFDEYYRAGVPLFVIVDQKREGGPRELFGYRWTPTGYEPIPLDAQGRLPLPDLGISLGLRDNRLVYFDTQTGADIGTYAQVAEAYQAAEAQARQEAEARQREVEARQAAEAQAQREAEARHAVEARLQELEAELRRLRGQGPP
jgi:Uma2 family endonuclease